MYYLLSIRLINLYLLVCTKLLTDPHPEPKLKCCCPPIFPMYDQQPLKYDKTDSKFQLNRNTVKTIHVFAYVYI